MVFNKLPNLNLLYFIFIFTQGEKMTIDQASKLEQGLPELKLIHCVDVISESDKPESVQEALQYLRSRATQHDTEAKTKLSIIYTEHHPLVKKCDIESSMWSRSVFDKQLSNALAQCSTLFSTSTDLSGINMITTGANQDKQSHLCYLAGLLYTKGIGFPQDLNIGIPFLKMAAEADQAEAACELGRIYGDRYKYSLNESAESIHWFERAFECGSNQAIVDLAYGFFEGSPSVPKDDTRAFRYAKEGALSNDKYCQYIVGYLYLKGRGVTEDVVEALTWLDASAAQGFAVALEEQTAVYMYGHGNVKQDFQKAYACCTQSAAINIPYCQARLGDMYRNGLGIDQDFHRAFEHYQNAASQADTPYPYAQHMLGEM
jgi:TPR repeat protein